MSAIATPYLLFLGDAPDQLAAKTAKGVAFWCPDQCVGQLRLPGCRADVGLPDVTLEEACRLGARTMIVGVANQGGFISEHWVEHIHKALSIGMDVSAGLHEKLSALPGIANLAATLGRQIHDVRHPTREFDVGRGRRRTGKRLLTVGTDVSVGKMFTTLALHREMINRGLPASFRATGQTGIFIAGSGISVDAVVADFISGAIEWLSPDAEPDHWDLIEGQGSLFHAAFAGVTLGLIHGAQPDVLVVCCDPSRELMRGTPTIKTPSVSAVIEASVRAAQLTNPDVKCVGIAANTSTLSNADTRRVLDNLVAETGLPCVDPVKHGVASIVDALVS